MPPSSSALPGPGERLRCTACGNLTRFDVVARRRTAAYWHYALSGALHVESERDLEAVPEQITCRWCGSDAVAVVPLSQSDDQAPDSPGPVPDDGQAPVDTPSEPRSQ